MRAQETLPRGSPRAVCYLCPSSNRMLNFSSAFHESLTKPLFETKNQTHGVRKPPSISNSVWQTCPRSREGSRGKQAKHHCCCLITGPPSAVFNGQSTSSYDFWIFREEADVFVAAALRTVLCCALALVNGPGKGNWGMKTFSLFKSRYLPIILS